jgi:flagellar basal-body rod protein FlgG
MLVQAINVSDTGLNASQSQLDTAGNNLANLNTTSFKANQVRFQDLFYITLVAPSFPGPAVGTQLGSGVRLSSTDKQFTQGPLISTGVPLDVAIDGQGFFQVLRPDGSTAYTRNGTFQVGPNGQLRTADGFLVQPPITIPPGTTQINIATNGTVSVRIGNSNTFQTVGQITLVVFANPPGLTAVGNNLYLASPASGSPVKVVPGQGGAGLIRQGFLEGSNVDAATELTDLLIAQQTFVANATAIQVANQMLQGAAALLVQ